MYRIVICDLFVTVGRIFFSIIEKFLFCLNQDIQDLRMYRIVICDLFVTVGRIFFSIIEKFLFCLNQDIQDLRICRMLLIIFLFVSEFKDII